MSYVNSVTVYPSSITITKGQWYYEAYASISSNQPECAEVEWYSNKPEIVSVNKTTGHIYGVNTGTTRVYAEATDGSGKKDYITVTVTAPVSVTGISICPTNLTMNVGDTDYIYETVYPQNATNQTVTWCSSDDSVAEVNLYSGFVRAKKAGIVTITACTVDGEYSDSCVVEVFIDTVTIQKDGDFNKVVFSTSGKVWRCINQDMIFDENNRNNNLLIKRSNYNFFTYYNENDPGMSNTTPKEYTDEEIKLLYAIDPYGVAYYIQKYVAELDKTLEEKVKEKDKIFRLLFQREPKYFARTLQGTWDEVDDYEEIDDVLSESEVYFGMHQIYDWHTFFEILGVCSSILNIVFATNFFTSVVAGVIVNRIVTTGLLVASGIESVLRNEFANHNSGDHIATAIDNTLPDWASNYISLYESLDDLADALTLNFNYNKEIIDYCACHTGYNVLFEMKNGTVYNLKEVCNRIDE